MERIGEDRWRYDKGIVMEAVMRDGEALMYASDALKNDEDVMKAATEGGAEWRDNELWGLDMDMDPDTFLIIDKLSD